MDVSIGQVGFKGLWLLERRFQAIGVSGVRLILVLRLMLSCWSTTHFAVQV